MLKQQQQQKPEALSIEITTFKRSFAITMKPQLELRRAAAQTEQTLSGLPGSPPKPNLSPSPTSLISMPCQTPGELFP